jgi:hypothetical protein
MNEVNRTALPLLWIIILMLATGCASTTVPVTMDFPEVPETLMQEPARLEPLPVDAREITDLLENPTVNYGKVRELRMKYLQWQRWYNTNRRLHKETTE